MPSTASAPNQKPGITYAATVDGIELPVVDVTHPDFAIRIGEAEQNNLIQQYLRDVDRPARLPAFLRGGLFALMRRRSVIMRGLMGASGGFMSGMNTYLMKLGPDHLDQTTFSDIDRRIAGSPAGLCIRLRLQDAAQLLAAGLSPSLARRPSAALHLLNIGGGPAMDSLNALILVRQQRPELLAGRPIVVHSLDLDEAGPSFGARALRSLLAPGAPLDGLPASFRHTAYDWSHPEELRKLAEDFDSGQAVVAASSEGALLEYGNDEQVASNLQVLHAITPAEACFVGSLTRADELGRKLNGREVGSRAALVFRGLEAFTALAARAGWRLADVIDRPLSHDLRLNKS